MTTTKSYAVSVVMSVYDKPQDVVKTIDSVLQQQAIDLEFIIVDDGADVHVKQVLEHYQQDSRISILSQHNKGLTKALIRGCEAASHEFIARIDAGDLMLESRLQKQASCLASDQFLSMVASWVEMVTEEGDYLYTVDYSEQQLNLGLHADDLTKLVSPAHFSVMFRRSHYQKVGGYRPEFYYAQDIDLWLRMIDCGDISVINAVLTRAIFSVGGISARYKKQQRQLAKLAIQDRLGDSQALMMASKIRPDSTQQKVMDNDIDGLYFIARCLTKTNPFVALRYYKAILTRSPCHIKAVLGYFQAKIRVLINS